MDMTWANSTVYNFTDVSSSLQQFSNIIVPFMVITIVAILVTIIFSAFSDPLGSSNKSEKKDKKLDEDGEKREEL